MFKLTLSGSTFTLTKDELVKHIEECQRSLSQYNAKPSESDKDKKDHTALCDY